MKTQELFSKAVSIVEGQRYQYTTPNSSDLDLLAYSIEQASRNYLVGLVFQELCRHTLVESEEL